MDPVPPLQQWFAAQLAERLRTEEELGVDGPEQVAAAPVVELAAATISQTLVLGGFQPAVVDLNEDKLPR
ncbi:MAG: hypothetical protein ACXVYB_16940 [Arthrobacter sp.]